MRVQTPAGGGQWGMKKVNSKSNNKFVVHN